MIVPSLRRAGWLNSSELLAANASYVALAFNNGASSSRAPMRAVNVL